nr:hypothetical protein BaRGS_028275 [Batillaria attramentaria]
MLAGNVKMEVMQDDDEELSDAGAWRVVLDAGFLRVCPVQPHSLTQDLLGRWAWRVVLDAGFLRGDSHAAEIAEKRKTVPHIYNLNMDPQLCGHIVHFIDEPEKTIGNGREESTEIVLKGPGIMGRHAELRQEADGKYSLEPLEQNMRLLLNGKAVVNKMPLKHNDRIVFGTTQYFVFCNPAEHENLLQEDIMELMPGRRQANSISEDLEKKMKFELMVVSPEG